MDSKNRNGDASEFANGNIQEADSSLVKYPQWRIILPQVLATCAQSLLLFALGMTIAMPTIVIGAVHKSSEELSMTDSQASWFMGVLLLMQPIGSVLSGIIQDQFGRKRTMLLVNAPLLLGWVLIFLANNVAYLFLASLLMGFSIGLMEAPTLTYVGEVAQPRLRGTLATTTSLFVTVGVLVMYIFGSVFSNWRASILMSCSIPVIIFLILLLVPESPVWLLIKNREREALMSLCWLRGWVPPVAVRSEFEEIKAHTEASRTAGLRSAYLPVDRDVKGPIKLTYMEKFKDIVRPELMRPLRLVALYFFFYHCAGMNATRPFLVHVFKSFQIPLDPRHSTVLSGVAQLIGNILCIIVIRKVGKRKLSLLSMSLCSFLCFTVGLYGYLKNCHFIDYPWVPLVLISSIFLFKHLGIGIIPWALISEVFPPRGRGLGGGLSAAAYYVAFFIVTKSFFDLENLFQIHGVYAFYGIIGSLGTLFLYLYLPETEGMKLEEVENFFKKSDKRTVSNQIEM